MTIKTEQERHELHELERRQVWANVWAMTANANDCKHTSTATRYADVAMQEYDNRFKPR